jgi:signal transduction histidine kinase/CheY-like chemotaxis protein
MTTPSSTSQREIKLHFDLSSIIDLIQYPVVVKNSENIIIIANKYYKDLLGITDEHVGGRLENQIFFISAPEAVSDINDLNFLNGLLTQTTIETFCDKLDNVLKFEIIRKYIDSEERERLFIKMYQPVKINENITASETEYEDEIDDKYVNEFENTMTEKEIKSKLTKVIDLSQSKYCFAAFVDAVTGTLKKLYMSSGGYFLSQRTDNENFKKFWGDSYKKNEIIIENELQSQCTITCKNVNFRVSKYTAVPMNFMNDTLIIILFNKEKNYDKNDLFEIRKLLENSKSSEVMSFEERIINSQRIESMGLLAGGMAHDFNNYLTGILNFVNLAKLCTINRQIEQYLDNTIVIINNAQTLTKQYLRFSKNNETTRKKNRIDQIIRDHNLILFSGTNISAQFHVDENLWSCTVDESKICQLFGSIIINAREALVNGGVIEISARNEQVSESDGLPVPSGKYVKIEIKDNGCGIPQDSIRKIFSPFFSMKVKRTGLGLTSAMMIAQRHGGHITVSSQEESGSVFTIYLPAIDEEKSVEVSKEDKKTKGKILLMDDECYIRQATSEILKRKNYEVVTATKGDEALELFKNASQSEVPFDIVILDLTVPDGMGGVETLKKLQVIDPDVKAIASSGYSDDPIISQPEKYGFTASLGKPYNLGEFLDLIKNVIFRSV